MSRLEWFLYVVLSFFLAGGLFVLYEWLHSPKEKRRRLYVFTLSWVFVVVVLALIGVFAPFHPVVETYPLEVSVYSQKDTTRIGGASLELTDSLRIDPPILQKTCDSEGKFCFHNLAASVYKVTARKPPEYKENTVSAYVPKDQQICIPLAPVAGGTVAPTPLAPTKVPPGAETLSKFGITFRVTDVKIAELNVEGYSKQLILLTGMLTNYSDAPVLFDLNRSAIVGLNPDLLTLTTRLQFDPLATSYLADRFPGTALTIFPGAPPLQGTMAFSSAESHVLPADLTFVNPELSFWKQPTFFWEREPITFELFNPVGMK